MKVNLKRIFTVFVFAVLCCNSSIAQIPIYRNANPISAGGVISGGMPFGVNAVSGARVQYFYPPSFMSVSSPSSPFPVTRLYFFADTTAFDTVIYTNISITLGEYSSAPSLAFAWNTSASKLTTVYSASGGCTLFPHDYNWFYIDLMTPYIYDPTKYMLLDIRVDGQSPFTNVWSIKSSSTSGSYLSATSGSASTPNTLGGGGSLPAIGMDPIRGINNAGIERPIFPAVCASSQNVVVKVKNSGVNVISSVYVGWSVNGIIQTPLHLTNAIDTFGSGHNDTLLTLGSVSFTSGQKNIVAWTYLPNGLSDFSTIDDTVSFVMASSLTGIYTIGTGSTANFPTISSAVTSLYSFGVCGPVTFMIDTGVFYEQVELIGRINGASPINTVTFKGVDQARSIIAFSPGVVNAKHIIKMQYVGYVTFRDLTIRSLSTTYGWGVHIRDSCVSVGIKNCIIDNSSISTSTSATNTVGITVSGPATGTCIPAPCATSLTAVSRADSLELDSNTILYGYEGINITGNATSNLGRNNKIRGNTILYAYQNSVNLVYQDNANVQNNVIMPRQTGAVSVGIFASNISSSGNGVPTIINGNKIYGYATSGISLNTSTSADSTNKGRITNNMIGGMEQLIDANPIYITGCKNWSVTNNTLNRDFPNTSAVTASGIRVLGTTSNISIKNNIISISKAGAALPLHILANSNCDSMDRNVLFRADISNQQVTNMGGTTYTVSTFKGAGGFNTNSVFFRPSFKNDTNLYLQNNCGFPAGEMLSYVSRDIDGVIRSVPPVVGAQELIRPNNNIALLAVQQPASPIVPGTYTMNLLIQNIGANSVSSFTIAYKVNSGTLVSQIKTLSIPMNPCDSTVISITGVTLTANDSIARLLVYTSLPNSLADADRTNDTLRVKLYSPLGGTYSIGGSGAHFATFADATQALQSAGIYRTVLMNVNAGTYNEQVTLTGPIQGLTPVNSIIFDGIDPATRIISCAGNAGAPHTVKIDTASYVTFKNLSIQNTGATYGWGVQITRNANACKIKNCMISMVGAGATSTAANYAGISVCGSSLTTATHADSLELDSNTIYYGYNGINLYASAGTSLIGINNKVRNNTIYGAYQNSIYLVYQQTPEVSFNTINCRGSSAGVGIYFQNVTTPATGTSFTLIKGNKMNSYATAGIYLNTCTNAANTLKGKIFNNVIGGLEKLAAGNSIYLTSSTNWSICNNSVNHDYTATTATTAAALRIVGAATASFGITLTNNILAVTGTGTGLPLYTQVAGNIDTMDYNNFYRADTTNGFAMYLGANVVFSGFKGNGGFNKNSMMYRPGFNSSTDLTPNPLDSAVWSLNGRGTYLPYAPVDFNGVQRPSIPYNGVPDIGAYEVTPLSMPPLAKSIPDTIIAGTVSAYLFGYDTVARINWSLSGVPPTIKIRQFTGVKPPTFDTTRNYMYFYTSVQAPVSTFFDTFTYYYRDNWIGTHLSETGLIPYQKDSSITAWYSFTGTSIRDIGRNIIKIPYYTNNTVLYYITASDYAVAVPVKLLEFAGKWNEHEVLLNWVTALELNCRYFEVQRSSDGISFHSVGIVDAKGMSRSPIVYEFTDGCGQSTPKVLFYRLKMVDENGMFEYSKIVTIGLDNLLNDDEFNFFPNPFSNELFLKMGASIRDQIISLDIFDMSGKLVMKRQINPGNDIISLVPENDLHPGMYFVKVYSGSQSVIRKLIKN